LTEKENQPRATSARTSLKKKPALPLPPRGAQSHLTENKTNHKGETIMLTSKQRAILRGKANTMDPVFIVGKGEIDETMIQGVKDCLDARELIKLKVLESSMYNAREASVKLAEATGADCVQVIGSKFVLYLQKKKDSAYADLLK
jgi:RNA-binding protein